MRQFAAFLTLGMVFSVAWAQESSKFSVAYAQDGVFVEQGYRSGGEFFVSPSLLRRIGWSVDSNNGTLAVLAEGRTFDLSPKIISGSRYYNLSEALRYVGAVVDWSEDSHVLTVLSQIRNVEKTSTGIRVDGTMILKPRAFRMTGPDRFVVDFPAARLSEKAVQALPANWHVSQIGPTTVRFVVESPAMATQAVTEITPSRNIEIAINASPGITNNKASQVIVGVGEPRVGADSKSGVSLTIPITGAMETRPSAVYLDPTTIQLQIPSSSATKLSEFDVKSSEFLDHLSMEDDKAGNINVTLKLKRALAFQLSYSNGNVNLSLNKPSATGGLAGKIIVVDAGHGGKDNGAVHGGVQEKDMTLLMAKTVASQLSAAGASVILSRSNDTFVSLGERPGVANRSHADLFISCHFNSNSVNESRSGIIIFHHKDTSQAMLLAECISHEIAKEKQLPDLGVWSDGRIYQSGFAVLRGSTMPAVLMELGFLNHSHDRARIQSQDFRDAIALAVVRGVKVFLNDGKKD